MKVELDRQTKESITWSTKQPSSMHTGRQAAMNVMVDQPGVRPEHRNATEPIDAWELLFDQEMIDLIVENTNVKIRKTIQSIPQAIKESSKNTHFQETTAEELRVLFGLWYIRGLL